MPRELIGFDDFTQRDIFRQIADEERRHIRIVQALRAHGFTVRATPIWSRQITRIDNRRT